MALARNLTLTLLGIAAMTATGCVGPMACGPAGCDTAGPLASSSCDGCGELYVDPWINHPPDACDPCDSCGNYNGQSCGKCRPILSGLACLWGYRYDGGGACGQCGLSSCDGCGGAADPCDGGCDGACGNVHAPSPVRGPVQVHRPDQPIPSGVPTPAAEGSIKFEGDVEIVPSGEPDYQPRRTRRIFRNRGGPDTEMPHSAVH